MKLVYAAEAVGDLRRLREFIAAHDPAAATRTGEELIRRIEMLPDFPEMGAPVQLAPTPESVRDMVFGKYVVRYSVHPSAVIILRVWHGLEDRR